MNNKVIEDAYVFFDGEDKGFKQEMEIDDLLVDIACEFIHYRVRNHLSQKELAEKLQMTQAMVSKLESGEYNPTIKMLFEIAKKLSWKFNVQFEDSTEKYDYQYEQVKNDVDDEYIDRMGFAS